jgi:serine/threonine protein kinase
MAEPLSTMLQLAGQWVGPFQLQKILGKGAMGVVYLAQDPVLRRSVALKLIAKADEHGDAEQHERFLREARAAARLVHPNVVQIFQVGETLDFRFIAMEYVEGTSLSRAAKQHGGRLPEPFGMERMREAADALTMAETFGIVHRDIKPSNLLMTPAGTLKVADFGLAAQSGGETIGAASGNQLEGTPFYMSPEHWSGEAITPAADIYSLGCTFFHLFVGTTPYPARDMFGSLQAHCWGPVPEPLAHLPTMDPRLAELLKNCMQKRPDERPRAREIVETLEEMLVLQRSLVRTRSRGRSLEDSIDQSASTVPYAEMRASLTRPPTVRLTPPPPSAEIPPQATATIPRTSSTRASEGRSYRDYYGFRDHPFSDIRQPGFYWYGGPFAEALTEISQALLAGKTCILAGVAGSGRTFTCESLPRKNRRFLMFSVEPQLLLGSPILVSLCRQAGVAVMESASHRFVLSAFLGHITQTDRPDAMPALVIDGLDPNDREVVDDIVALRKVAPGNRLGIVLTGAEDLLPGLAARPESAALARDAVPVTLRAMNQGEMASYVRHRVTEAGGGNQLELDAAAQQLLFVRTGGNPKLVNVYCHNALTLAAILGEPEVKFKTLRIAMKSKTYLTAGTALALIQDEAASKS